MSFVFRWFIYFIINLSLKRYFLTHSGEQGSNGTIPVKTRDSRAEDGTRYIKKGKRVLCQGVAERYALVRALQLDP